MAYQSVRLLHLLFLSLFFFACSKNDDRNDSGVEVDLNKAKINQFQFAELSNLPTTIEHPVLVNGTEVQRGKITITFPADQTNWELTPLTSNFQEQAFRIEPALGRKTNYESGRLVYSIQSTRSSSRKVHYEVIVTRAAPLPLALSGFKFLKASNPSLPQDVQATRIIENIASIGYVYIFVPRGTDLTQLIATIDHNATTVFYTQDENEAPVLSNTAYPAAGLSIDLKYPKPFFIALKRGGDVRTFSVIVDYEDPISLNVAGVQVPNLAVGSNHSVKIAELENRGNHPIGIGATTYEETFPANITVIRSSVAIPAGGLLPGEKTDVMATINATNFPPGTYVTTAIFPPQLFRDQKSSDLLTPASLKITAELVP